MSDPGGRETPSRASSSAPAAWAAAAFIVGITAGARSGSGGVAALALAAVCGAWIATRFLRGPAGLPSHAAGLLLFAALGFAEATFRIARPARLARETYRNIDTSSPDRAERIEGVLDDFWTGDPPRARCRLRAGRIRVGSSWRPFPAEVFLFVSGDEPVRSVADRGDRVEAVGKLRPEGYPASDRDIALPWPAYRLSVKSSQRIERPRPTWLSAVTAANRWLFSRLPSTGSRSVEFDRDVRGPLAALLLGRTSELDRGMVARYRRGGMYHLLVLAGLHVGLLAGLLLILLRALSVRGHRRDAILLLAVVGFVIVGGANPPAVRAALVFTIFMSARWLERPIAAAQAIGLSALALFAADPKQVFSLGCILTFAAVCGIASFAAPLRSRLPRRPSFFWSGLAAAAAAQIATAPILLWRFNVVAAGAWLTAPLTVSIAAGLIAAGSVVLLLFAAGLPAAPVVFLFGAGSRLLETLADRAAGVAFLRPTPPLAAILAVGALLGAGGISHGRVRAAALAAAAALFAALAILPGPRGPERGFSIEALDVGQGDALLLRWASHTVLIDGGGPFDLDARDFGRTHLLPKMLDRGVTRIDAALLTHPHPDHALGLFSVLEEIPAGAFWRSAGEDESAFQHDLAALAHSRSIPVRVLREGESVRWTDARLDILHSGGARSKRDATNNQSVVARFERDGRSALLTGDAGAAAEAAMLRGGASLRSDLLKVGHHGSRGSTTPSFLAAVAPRAALLSCGRENRFGHPALETLGTLAAARVPLFRTDLSSDVLVELAPSCTRLRRRDVP